MPITKIPIVTQFVLKQFAKKSARKSEGIATLLKASDPVVQSNVRNIEIILKNMGINPKNLTSTDDVLNAMNYHKAMVDQHLKQQFKGLDLDKGIKSLEKKPKVISQEDPEFQEITDKLLEKKKYDDITKKMWKDRPFPGANLKAVPKITIDEHITFIKSKEPIESMKEANKVIKREGRYKNLTNEESQKILKDTDDHIFERDIQYDEFGDPIKPEPDYASGGRVPLMYGGDPGFAFEYGGSWADWRDRHQHQMPVTDYIKTKLPKERLPFRDMQEGGIARAGFPFGGPAAGKKALKAIMDAWRANKTWGVGGPPYKPEATSFNIKEMTKRNLGKELSLTDLRRLSESPLAGPQKGHFEDFNKQFKNIKAQILREKMMEKKLEAKASINAAEATMKEAIADPQKYGGDLEMSRRITDQMIRDSKQSLGEVREGLKEIDIYMGMLQKKGRSLHQSGGLAYMLGEPTYMKYEGGGSVGHAPWLKPTGRPQPEAHQETPTPHVASRPNPMKAPRGIPSLAPKNMDPAHMQQQMMQQAMMGQGQGIPGQGPRPMANAGGRIGYAGGGIFKLLKMLKSKPKPKSNKLSEQDVAALKKKYGLDPESAKKDDEAFKLRLQQILAKHSTKHAEGGMIRTGFKKGGDMSRRGFMKLIAGLAALPVFGKYFKAAKPIAKVAETFTHVPIKDIPGMPVWFKPLVARVIKEGTDVTKKYAIKDMEVVHHAKLPGSGTDVLVTQQLDTGDVLVDIGMGKHGWSAGRYGQPARLEYKAAEDIMTGPSDEPFKSGRKRDPFLEIKTKVHEDLVGSGLKGDPKSLHLKPGKTKEEFWVDEAEFTGGHPENVKFEESVAEKYGDHASDFTEIEKYATGKNIDKKIIGKKAKLDDDAQVYAESRAEGQLEDIDPDDFAKGGLAGLLGE